MTTVCLSFDFDALSVWITSLKQTTSTPLSRGEYGARVGVRRILDLLRAQDVPATFFVPGHSAVTFPDVVKEIADHGHEIAAHNYLHELPSQMSLEEERSNMIATEEALFQVTGIKPVGYRSPGPDLSVNTLQLLVERGYLYDSSLMADDFTPYTPRAGDRIDKDGTVTWGKPVPLVEFPACWELDDFVYFQHLWKPRNEIRSPEEVEKIWLGEFDYCANHVENGVFNLVMHPQVIGRGPRIIMLGNLIAKMKGYSNVTFSRMDDCARRLIAQPAANSK